MSVITRRQAICMSGLAFAAPLTADTSAAVTQRSNQPHARIRLNHELVNYTSDGLGRLMVNLARGRATSDEVLYASQKSRLLAHHVDNMRVIDPLFRKRIQNVTQGSQPIPRETIAAALHKYDPTIRASDLYEMPTLSPAEFNSAKESFASWGLSGWLHRFSDALKHHSGLMAEVESSHVNGKRAHMVDAEMIQTRENNLRPAVYRYNQTARKMNASFSSACSTLLNDIENNVSFCGLLASAAFIEDTAVIATLAVCSTDALLSLGLDAVTAGVAAGFAPEEVAICGLIAGKSNVIATAIVNWAARAAC